MDLVTLALAKKIIDNTAADIRKEVEDLSVFTFKGKKEHIADLPLVGKVGDVWHVLEDKNEYVWFDNKWEDFGGIINLEDYSTTEEVEEMINSSLDDYATLTYVNTAIADVSDLIGEVPSNES